MDRLQATAVSARGRLVPGRTVRLAVALAALVVAGLAATQNAEAAGGTFLRIESQPGDFIGQGNTFVREAGTWTFTPSNVTATAFSVTVSGPGETWSLSFASNEGSFVSGHTYFDAHRIPNHSGHNGMAVSAGGRGCSSSRGEFTVRELAITGSTLTKLDLVFVQYCGSNVVPTRGELAYNASIGNSAVLPKLWLGVIARQSAGDNIAYNANVYNSAVDESGLVTFELAPPEGSTFVSMEASQGSCNASGTCQLGTIAPEDLVHVTLVVHPSETGILGATAGFETSSSGGTSSYGVNFFTPVTVPRPKVQPGLSFTSLRDVNPVLYSVAADGAGESILAPSANPSFEPVWSPDGTRVLFDRIVDGNDDIYVANVNGTNLTRLTTHPGIDEYPSWSPDGQKIVFDSDRNSPGTQHVFVMNADGTGVTQLTFGNGYDDTPSFSPDGSKIAFNSDRTGNWEIFVMSAAGGALTNLTNNNADDTSRPAWSPNGAKIAFTSDRTGNSDVWVMNANGSAQTNLTATNAWEDANPAWSPDGTKIAYDSNPGGNNDIWTMSAADGNGKTRITTDPAYDFGPYWWPEPYPSAPAVTSVVAGDGRATITFTPPGDPGFGAIQYYVVTASPGSHGAVGLGSPITVLGLDNGTSYTFTVAAFNGYGLGAPSAPSSSVVPFTAVRDHADPPSPAAPRPQVPDTLPPVRPRPSIPGH
jgi:hypothetical protein